MQAWSLESRDEIVLPDFQSFDIGLQAISPLLLPGYGKLFYPYFTFIKKYHFLKVGNKDICSYELDLFHSEECRDSLLTNNSYLLSPCFYPTYPFY